MRVRKRDGHEESFDALRLQEAIERALRASGGDDVWARQFRDCVMLELGGAEVAETGAVAQACATVLERFDCGAAAAAYRGYRDAECAARQAWRVHVPGPGGPRSAPWDRARLHLALQRDRYLERAVARQVARRVERRLVSMGQRHVTGRLVSFRDMGRSIFAHIEDGSGQIQVYVRRNEVPEQTLELVLSAQPAILSAASSNTLELTFGVF